MISERRAQIGSIGRNNDQRREIVIDENYPITATKSSAHLILCQEDDCKQERRIEENSTEFPSAAPNSDSSKLTAKTTTTTTGDSRASNNDDLNALLQDETEAIERKSSAASVDFKAATNSSGPSADLAHSRPKQRGESRIGLTRGPGARVERVKERRQPGDKESRNEEEAVVVVVTAAAAAATVDQQANWLKVIQEEGQKSSNIFNYPQGNLPLILAELDQHNLREEPSNLESTNIINYYEYYYLNYFKHYLDQVNRRLNYYSHSLLMFLKNLFANLEQQTLLIAIILILIILVTFIGNVLVCLSVIKVRKLRHPSNYLLISLAISDLCVACLVMPFGFYQALQDKWQLGRVLCNIYVVSDVTSCTASILNLCVISIDRYLAITRPLTYCSKRTTRLMLLLIAIVWICACLISGNEYGSPEEPRCEVSQSLWYQLYATCISFYIPLIVMICLYYNIYTAAKRVVDAELRATTGLHVNNKQTTPAPPIASSQQPTSANQRSGSSMATTFSFERKRSRRKQQSLPANCHNQLDKQLSMLNNTTGGRPQTPAQVTQTSATPNSTCNNNAARNCSTLAGAGPQPPPVPLVPVSVPVPNSGSRTSSVMRERKASITLGVIMSAFTICWLPFFIIALLRPFSETVDNLPRTFVLLTLWLGYANSLLNPIIYVTFHHDFRNAFKHLLCLRCMTINEHIRKDEYKFQYGETHHQEKIRNLRNQQQQQQQQLQSQSQQQLLLKKQNQLL